MGVPGRSSCENRGAAGAFATNLNTTADARLAIAAAAPIDYPAEISFSSR
jgi:hypothetical protein